MAKRQTIWLSTMMVLSLMLIGFYTVNNNVQQVSSTDKKAADTTTEKADSSKKDQAVMEQSDYFIAKHIQENQDISQQQENLETVIADAKASPDNVDKAKTDLKTLMDQADQVDKVVDQITTEGYPDALVDLKEGKINVTVEAQNLDNKKAIKIMNIVSKEMKVSASKITVFAHE